MANAARADEQSAQQVEAPEKDSPLLDLYDAAVKKFIKTAKARGFVTLNALNAVLPSGEVSPDQIEDTMSMLSDMGITVVESEDHEEGPGIWRRYQGPVKKDGPKVDIEVYTFLTTTPNELVATVNHERMPVLLTREEEFRDLAQSVRPRTRLPWLASTRPGRCELCKRASRRGTYSTLRRPKAGPWRVRPGRHRLEAEGWPMPIGRQERVDQSEVRGVARG